MSTLSNLEFSRTLHHSGGFSLVELLVAMGLGVLLMFGVITVFDSTREGSRVQEAMSSVQDSGRIAMEFITRDFRNADFAGCVNDKSRVQNLVTGGDATVTSFFTGGGITGTASASSATIADSDGTSYSVIDGTSTVRIVGAQPACDGITNIDNSAGDEADPIALRATCPIDPGTVLLVSNCYFGDIFVKTNAATDANIQHTTSAVDGLANSSANFQTTYGNEAQVLQPFVRDYFIADNGRGSNSLYRRDSGEVQELVPNVVDFKITYGSDDADDDGAADVYAMTPADMATVVSARVELTVRSSTELHGNPVERTYTGTSNVRNRVILSEASATP